MGGSQERKREMRDAGCEIRDTGRLCPWRRILSKKNAPYGAHHFRFGGERGIRTPGPFGSTVFKTAALDRSAISPRQK